MSQFTLQGKPITLLGNRVKKGDQAPDFTVLAHDQKPVSLRDTGGGVRIFCAVPSLDTPVCDQQTRRFNEEAASLDDVTIWTVSVDLPFAQNRWCGAAGIEKVQTVSDHRDLSFGNAYGVVIKELRLLARSVFVVDRSDRLVHVEYVAEMSQYPDFEAVLEAAAKAG